MLLIKNSNWLVEQDDASHKVWQRDYSNTISWESKEVLRFDVLQTAHMHFTRLRIVHNDFGQKS